MVTRISQMKLKRGKGAWICIDKPSKALCRKLLSVDKAVKNAKIYWRSGDVTFMHNAPKKFLAHAEANGIIHAVKDEREVTRVRSWLPKIFDELEAAVEYRNGSIRYFIMGKNASEAEKKALLLMEWTMHYDSAADYRCELRGFTDDEIP